jgi:hypothetical protein
MLRFVAVPYLHNIFFFYVSAGDTGDRSGSSWVGAWWLGFVLCGLGALVLALPISLLPSSLPGVEQPSSDQVCRSRLASRTSSFRKPFIPFTLRQKNL